MNDEFDKEQIRGLFATSLLVIVVSALLGGDKIFVFPPNFLVPFIWPLSLLVPPLTVSFKSIAVTYVMLWIIYAFAMSLAYSDSGARFMLGRHPRILVKLSGWRISRVAQVSKLVANLSFFGGLLTFVILGVLMALWYGWFLIR